MRAAYDTISARRAEYERSHGRFVTVNGIKMHYLEWGAPNGVPLVWAHGSASSAYEIRAVAPRLVQAGYRVLAVDYRGHGLTRVRDYDFGIPRMVFRRLRVPMMILDPQEERDHLPVTDQNEWLAKAHPDLVTHRIYAQSGHNIFQSRPDWFVRDAVELLDQVRRRRR